MILAFLFFTINTVTNSVLGLEITEIELNPPGTDSNNEWLELYSPEPVNLEPYILVNGKGKTLNLSGELEGYRVITVPNNWLVNTNASVFLLEGNTIIQQALLLRDSFNDDRTWNYCSNEWVFSSSSRGVENSCNAQEEEEPHEEIPDEEESEDEPSEQVTTPPIEKRVDVVSNTSGPRVRSKIVLGSETETSVKKEIITSEGYIRDILIYVFAGVCVVLIILLLLRKT